MRQGGAVKKIGIALSGGGSKGLSHIAFLKALDEMGLRPSIMAGTSTGAVIGGFYAAGISGAEIENIANNIDFLDLGRMLDVSIWRSIAFFRGDGIVKFLRKRIPARRFEDLQTPMKIVAADFWKRQEVIFDSGELIPAIRASMSLPAIFEPVQIGGRVFVDGGLVNPLPYDIIRKDCNVLVAIDVSGAKTAQEEDVLPGMFESLVSSFQILEAAIVEAKMRMAKPDIYVRPSLENIRVLEFNRFDEIMDGVQDDVGRFKLELEHRLKKSFSFFKRFRS